MFFSVAYQKIKLFGNLIQVEKWSDIERRTKDTDKARFRPIKAILFCCEEDKPFLQFIKGYWEKLDSLSGLLLDLFTVLPKTTPLQLYDKNGRPYLRVPSAKILVELQNDLFGPDYSVSVPSIVFFYSPRDAHPFEIALGNSSESDLAELFAELMAILKEVRDDYENHHIRTDAKDLFLRFTSKLRRRDRLNRLRLLPYRIPPNIVEGLTVAAVKLAK